MPFFKRKPKECPKITGQYTDVASWSRALQNASFVPCRLVIGVNYTRPVSIPTVRGMTFAHETRDDETKDYELTLNAISEAFNNVIERDAVKVYGFGDDRTKDQSVFSFCSDRYPCNKIKDVPERYERLTPNVTPFNFTSLAPIIWQAMSDVNRSGLDTNTFTKRFHVLTIITEDLSMGKKQLDATRQTITHASNFPLSIVVIGIGSGDFAQMSDLENELENKRFDNFHVVLLDQVKSSVNAKSKGSEIYQRLALSALSKLPVQYEAANTENLFSTPVRAQIGIPQFPVLEMPKLVDLTPQAPIVQENNDEQGAQIDPWSMFGDVRIQD